MTKAGKSKIVRKIAKYRGQYYVTLGMLENHGACHLSRNAIAKRLKLGAYPRGAVLNDAIIHPKRDEPIRITEELLREVMGERERSMVATPWQVAYYLGVAADALYNSEVRRDYDDWNYGEYNHAEHVDKVVSLFREWGYIE